MKIYLAILIFLVSTISCTGQFFEENFTYKLPSGTVNVDMVTSEYVKLSYSYKNNGCLMKDVDLQYWNGAVWVDFIIGAMQQDPVVYGTADKYSLSSGTTYDGRLRLENCAGIYEVTFEFTTATSTTVPEVSTSAATSVSATEATLNGNVTGDGGETVTERGFYWSSTLPVSTKVTAGSGTGTFNTVLSGLTPNTNYYFQAYATNTNGEAMGDIDTLTTSISTSVPTVSTLDATNIQESSAIVGGNISYNGNSGITEAGICYSTGATPTTADNKVITGVTQGGFYLMISGLLDNTTYYFRAYAINGEGIGYGDILDFTTLNESGLATVTTTTATSIGTSTVTLGGNVTSDGGSTVVSRGVCIGTSPNPTAGPGSGSGTGVFIINHTGLTPGTSYYYRAYAVNSTGINYGAEYSFQTLIPISVPTITTLEAFNVTDSTSIAGGSIGYNGNSGIIEAGVCYSTGATPTIANSKVITGTTSGGFYVMLDDLLPGTTYYYRAYAINSIGTGYGSILSFETEETISTLPTVTTDAITNISYTTATGGGNVTDDGGSTVTTRGLVWNTTGNPSLFSYSGVFATGTGEGTFSGTLSNLTCGVTYHVKAFATNSVGTSYGNEVTFQTNIYGLSTIYLIFDGVECDTPWSSGFNKTIEEMRSIADWIWCPGGTANGNTYRIEGSLAVGKQLYQLLQC